MNIYRVKPILHKVWIPLEIIYTYIIDNKEYKSNRLSHFVCHRNNDRYLDEILKKYKSGTKLRVFITLKIHHMHIVRCMIYFNLHLRLYLE